MSHLKPTILHLLRDHAVSAPNTTAIIHEPAEAEPYEVTYSRLWQRVNAAATQIEELSSQGDRVVLLFPSGTEFVEAFLGCMAARRIAVPASIPRNERAIDRTVAIVRDSGASLIVTTSALVLKLQTMLHCIPFAEGTTPRVLAIDSTRDASHELDPDWESADVAFLQYTSGSTANPKGVIVAHENLADNLARIHEVFGFDESTKLINWLPVHHDMGLIGGILAPLAWGCSTVLMSPIEFIQRPIRWLELVTRYGGTISGAPNFAYDACVNRIPKEKIKGLDLGSWRVAFNGSEPIRAQTFERFARKFESHGFNPEALFPCYGLAESTLLVAGKGTNEYRATSFDREALKHHRAVPAHRDGGRTLVGCGPTIEAHDLRIVHPETKTQCDEDQVGEVWLSGPSVCKGYWNREEETIRTFSAQIEGDLGRRFLRTGDLGVMREGQLYISGRLKNIVIIRGLNYACEDIEDLSQASHPAIAGAPCAAFGIEGPSGEELVVAQEVRRAFISTLDPFEIVGAIQESIVLNHGVRASEVVLVNPRTLPRTTSGKLQRPQARDLYLAGKLDLVTAPEAADDLASETRAGSGS